MGLLLFGTICSVRTFFRAAHANCCQSALLTLRSAYAAISNQTVQCVLRPNTNLTTSLVQLVWTITWTKEKRHSLNSWNENHPGIREAIVWWRGSITPPTVLESCLPKLLEFEKLFKSWRGAFWHKDAQRIEREDLPG